MITLTATTGVQIRMHRAKTQQHVWHYTVQSGTSYWVRLGHVERSGRARWDVFSRDNEHMGVCATRKDAAIHLARCTVTSDD